jgi:hypothetical protein
MRNVPDGLLDALSGSNGAATIQFNSWYQGKVTSANLPVVSYSFDYDITRQVVGQMSCSVLDNTGQLSPWSINDPLGVGGAQVQAQYVCQNYIVPIAMNRITKADPEETWHVVSNKFRWVQNSAEIALETKDLTVVVLGNRFMAAEAPAAGGTVFSEIRRLLTGSMEVIIDPGLTDKAVSSTVVYKDDRLGAIQDLVATLDGAGMRVTASGQLSVYAVSTTPVFTASGGVEGTFMKLTRSMAIEDFPNAVVSTATAPDGTSLFGVATQGTGNGYFGGPHGRWPVFHNAALATTQGAVNADASTYLANMVNHRSVEVPLRIMFHPCIEAGDYIGVNVPILSGSTKYMLGRIKTLRYSGTVNAPGFMDVVLQVDAGNIQSITLAMRQARYFGQL